MISIIVCSINANLFSRFSESLAKTIGVDYEVIRIENHIEKLSIAKAYNKGASQAIYDLLVFVHEDVVFHTENWGKNLLEHFKSLENPGIIGIAGNSYHPLFPSDWWVPSASFRHFNFISNKKGGKSEEGILMSSQDKLPKKVICTDGVFMAVYSNVFSNFLFDESLMGFHGYDTSISLRVSKDYVNYFVPDILIEHFSSGNYTNEFWKNTVIANLVFFEFYRRKSVGELCFEIEFYSLKKNIINLFRYKLRLKLFFKIIKLVFKQLFS